jgi:hypothetical protein
VPYAVMPGRFELMIMYSFVIHCTVWLICGVAMDVEGNGGICYGGKPSNP